MPRLLTRLIAIFLAACLIAETAAAGMSQSLNASFALRVPSPIFECQALSGQAIDFLRTLLTRRPSLAREARMERVPLRGFRGRKPSKPTNLGLLAGAALLTGVPFGIVMPWLPLAGTDDTLAGSVPSR